jgi:hypothetical protein
MKLEEALEILREDTEARDRAFFKQLDQRLTQIMKELRKRSRNDPGSKTVIEPMIRKAGEIDLDLSKLQRSFIALDGFAKKFNI